MTITLWYFFRSIDSRKFIYCFWESFDYYFYIYQTNRTYFVKDKFTEFFEPINKELNDNDAMVTHLDLLNYLRKREKEGFQHAMEIHFKPYSRFISEKKYQNPGLLT